MKRVSTLLILALALQVFTLVPLTANAVEEMVEATTPKSRMEQEWWRNRFVEKLRDKDERKEDIGLVFIGDSITHGWENAGKEIWEANFAPYGALDLGYGGDRTEHVIWRLQHGEVAYLNPKCVVLMIGTNNTGHGMQEAEHTVAGIEMILDELRERLPDSEVLLLAIFPRDANADDAMRTRNEEINAIIKKFDRRRHVTYLDINHVFLTDDGVLTKEVMPDLLHPQAPGYQLWADAIMPAVKKIMED